MKYVLISFLSVFSLSENDCEENTIQIFEELAHKLLVLDYDGFFLMKSILN
jgi:hypothetical protein